MREPKCSRENNNLSSTAFRRRHEQLRSGLKLDRISLLSAAVCIVLASLPSFSFAQERPNNRRPQPLVLGHGKGLFRIGRVIAQDDFVNLDDWCVQQEETENETARVKVHDGTLDCYLPGTGCTIWFRQNLKTRVVITYNVQCPTHDPAVKDLLPRDINNFWMASDPTGRDQGLFDETRYTGSFPSYNKMHGYYASTGGRKNQTTRLRRYPREVGGKLAPHVALNDKDGRHGYLITPDKLMKIQLVAYDDLVQYIVDGKLVYQIRRDDVISIENRDDNGKLVQQQTDYTPDRFPIYKEGYFGFRMVGTHHIYSNFRVHALEPDQSAKAQTRPTVRVATLQDLR